MTKLLYIEDDRLNIRLIQKMLTGAGFEMHIAANGKEGLDKVYELRPDVVLMDVNLPDINGLELTTQIKAEPQISNTKIVALTANNLMGDREKALKAGCDEYLAKPTSRHELIRTLKSVAHPT